MAGFARVNGLGHATDTLYSSLQLKVFKLVTTVNEETSLTGGIGGQIEALAQEFGTTGALIEADGENIIFIGDGHALDIDIVAKRANAVLGGAVTDSVSNGVCGFVTVTTPASLFGM